MKKITIDIEKIGQLVEDGVDLFLTPDAEDSLVELLEIQTQVEEAIKVVKAELETRGLEANPNFKSIQGDKIRVGYRFFGAEYKVDEANVDKLPENLYSVKKYYSVNSKELKEYVKQHKGIPQGISTNDRKKTITISLKGAKNAEE